MILIKSDCLLSVLNSYLPSESESGRRLQPFMSVFHNTSLSRWNQWHFWPPKVCFCPFTLSLNPPGARTELLSITSSLPFFLNSASCTTREKLLSRIQANSWCAKRDFIPNPTECQKWRLSLSLSIPAITFWILFLRQRAILIWL